MQVVVGCCNKSTLGCWRSVIRDRVGITVEEIGAATFRQRSGLDALLVSGILARERLGATAPRGRSEIIEAVSALGCAQFYVTTPVFVGHLEWIDGTAAAVPHDRFAKESEMFRRYYEVFRAITEFNRSHPENVIAVLGVHLDMIGSAEVASSSSSAEAADFLSAYLTHFQIRSKMDD